MKPKPFSLVLVACAALPALAFARGQITFDVVTEQSVAGAAFASPSADSPVTYVIRDGGAIDAGDPIAGEKPPAPDAVARALHQALASRHYQPATDGRSPAVLLTYHWGVIRPVVVPSVRGMRPGFGGFDRVVDDRQLTYDTTLRARIALVAPSAVARETQDRFVGINHLPVPGYVTPAMRDALQDAMDAHYFIIVSAYDYAALTRGETTLLWRTRLSTLDNAGEQDRVVVTLAAASGPYLGRNARRAEIEKTPLLAEAPAGAAAPPAGADDEPVATQKLIQQLVAREHAVFSGEPGTKEDPFEPAPIAKTALSPELARRVAAYQQEKAALQAALAARLKSRTPGADTTAALDAFNRENAARIAALSRTRETLRDDLARAAAAAGPGDKSLDALRREFANDAGDLSAPAAGTQP